MYINRNILYLLLSFFSISLYSQDNLVVYKNRIDSLEKLTRKTRKSELAEVYKKISENYINMADIDQNSPYQLYLKALDYADKENKIGVEINNDFYIGSSLLIKGRVFGILADFNNDNDTLNLSIDFLKKAITFLSKTDSLDNLIIAYNKLIVAYQSTGELDKAIQVCDTVSLLKLDQIKKIRNLTEFYYLKGTTHAYKNDFPKSIETFLTLLNFATANADTISISRSLNSLGAIEFFQGNYSKALEYYIGSLNISQKKKETSKNDIERDDAAKEAAVRQVNIGNVLKEMKQYDQALKYYNDALSYFQQKNDSDSKGFAADCFNNIGIIFGNQKKFEEAESYYEESIKLSQDIKDSTKLMTTYINLGYTQTDKEEYSKARQSYQRALRIATAMGDKRRIALISANLGDVYQSDNQPKEAINYYNSSLQRALELGIKDLQKQIYQGLSNSYEMLGDLGKALEYYKLFSTTKDSLLNENTQQIISELNTKYQTEQKEKDNQLLKSNNETLELKGKRDQLVKWGMGFIITLIMVFAVFVYIQLQEKKKKNILLAEQKEEIEAQRDEIMVQKDLLAKQKQEITDSIYYARRIQRAVLPPEQASSDLLPEHFILFKPRDIVSGDFYWMTKRENKTILVDADCTGHGVPGAFMSMLGVAFLNEIVSGCDNLRADLILNQLREFVKTTLGQRGKQDEAKDGMDIALCIIEWDTNTIQYAGAYNPLYYFKNGVFNEIKADKMPIGIYIKDNEPFTNNVVEFSKGDTFYIFSDGYVSQFGGTDGRKFMTKPFKALLETIQSRSMAEQMKILDEALLEWQGNFEQVDDISVIGFRF